MECAVCRYSGLKISFFLNVVIEECFVFVFHSTKVDFSEERCEQNLNFPRQYDDNGGKEDGCLKKSKNGADSGLKCNKTPLSSSLSYSPIDQRPVAPV